MQHDAPTPPLGPLCLCNSNRAWGGGERWHLECALYMARAGTHVTLACRPEAPLWNGVRETLRHEPDLCSRLTPYPWNCSNLSFLNPLKTRAFAAMLRERNIRHIITNLPADMKAATMARRSTRHAWQKPTLLYRRGSAIPVAHSLSNRFFYAALDGLIANSQETARLVNAHGILLDPGRIHVMYNGIDASRFDAAFGAPRRADADLERGLILGNAGRLTTQKGQIYLLHMSAVLKRRGIPHRLIIAGAGPLHDELTVMAHALGLTQVAWDAVRDANTAPQSAELCLTGFLDDLTPFWRQLHLFVLSSLWEGFGFVLTEAMLAQLPLLAFRINSMPELIQDGVNGRLTEAPREGEAPQVVGERLADNVLAMTAHPQGLTAMGEAGRAICLERFSQDAAMHSLYTLLSSFEAVPPA